MPSFQCPKCKRTFSMAAHLARHMNSKHNAGGARKKMKGKVGRPKGSRNKPKVLAAASALGGGSQVVDMLQSYHAGLAAQRDQLDRELAGLSAALQAIGGGGMAAPAKRGPGRPKGSGKGGRRGPREGSLKQYIGQVMRGSGAMSPQDIAAAVKRAGYQTKSADLTKAVSNTLPQIRGIKRIGFGMYRM